MKPTNIICNDINHFFLFENDLERFIAKNSSRLNHIDDLEYFAEKNYFEYRYLLGLDENLYLTHNRSTVGDFNQFGHVPMCHDVLVRNLSLKKNNKSNGIFFELFHGMFIFLDFCIHK